MQHIHYELGILAKCVHFKNLSAAAIHVGLSQPQLSRIISKLESELKIILLDRSAKRKSGWTPLAYDLAKLFEKNSQRLEIELTQLTNKENLSELRIGTLEGLSNIAMDLVKIGFDDMGIKRIVLDIYDMSDLEANFLSGNLDIILTSRVPGKQKFKNLFTIGYQKFEKVETNSDYHVYTPFEFNKRAKKLKSSAANILISNSLSIKKDWLKNFGGTAEVPTEPRKGSFSNSEPVLIIASEVLGPVVWTDLISNYNKN